MLMLTLAPAETDIPAAGAWVTTLPLSVASQLLVLDVVTVSPWPCRVLVATVWLSPTTFATTTVFVVAAQMPMATAVPTETDVPPGGFWVTTLPLSVASQLLVLAVVTRHPWPCRVLVATVWLSPTTFATTTVFVVAARDADVATAVQTETDVPPGGFWVTTSALLSVASQLLVLDVVTVSPWPCRVLVATDLSYHRATFATTTVFVVAAV